MKHRCHDAQNRFLQGLNQNVMRRTHLVLRDAKRPHHHNFLNGDTELYDTMRMIYD